MTFKDWFLQEMPIQVNLLGKWNPEDKPYRWDKPSVGILTSPVGVQKIQQKWAKLPQQFNAWMLKGPGASKYAEVGEVDPGYLEKNLKLKIVNDPKAPNEIKIEPNAINVIYTQNIGAERMPMNYWTIAHRWGHAISARRNDQTYEYLQRELLKDLRYLLEYGFGIKRKETWMQGSGAEDARNLKLIAQALGTMGSARKGWIRNVYEFPRELISQYIMSGKVTFNKMPFKLITSYAWGRPQYRYPTKDSEGLNDYIEGMEDSYSTIIDEILERAVGKIYVM